MSPPVSTNYRLSPSFPRKRESQGWQRRSCLSWTPAFAGVTITYWELGIHFKSGSWAISFPLSPEHDPA